MREIDIVNHFCRSILDDGLEQTVEDYFGKYEERTAMQPSQVTINLVQVAKKMQEDCLDNEQIYTYINEIYEIEYKELYLREENCKPHNMYLDIVFSDGYTVTLVV